MPRYVESTSAPILIAGQSSSFTDDFGDLLPDIIKVAIPSTQNIYGEATLAASVSYAGRVMRKSSARRDLNSVEFVSPMQCVLNCKTPIPLNAVVTIPDGTTHIVRDSETYRDHTNAPHHVTVYFAA